MGASTGDALRHLDEMIQQAAAIPALRQPISTWNRFSSFAMNEAVRRSALFICVLVAAFATYTQPQIGWPLSLPC
jgi:hypothetical protein